MLDTPGKNGHSNGNGKLIVEDLQNMTFQVHRSVFVSPDILEDENRAFVDFLQKLRDARDKAEFDQFMDERKQPDAA